MLAVLFLFISCEEFIQEEKAYVEAAKTVEGSWKIIQAYRNDVDITHLMDFSRFRLNFKADHSYSIDHYLPFLVDKNGTWELDDPQYPFKILFAPGSGTETVETKLNFPIVKGIRQIRLSFSAGCAENSYTYVFEEATN